MDITVGTLLIIIAGVLAAIELFNSQARSLLAWAVLIIAIALVLF